MNDPLVQLVEGYEILYASGAEPTSSATAPAFAWSKVLDPGDPTSVLPTVPYGERRVRIALPRNSADNWIATRIVHTDCSLNGSKVFDPTCTVAVPDDAPLGSWVSSHCGPVVEN